MLNGKFVSVWNRVDLVKEDDMFSPNIQPPPLVSPDNNGRQFKPGIFLFVLGLVMIVLVLILNDFSSFAMELAFIFGLISLLFFLLTINQDYGFGPIMKIILAVLIVGAVGLIISNFYYVEHEPLERNVIEFIY